MVLGGGLSGGLPESTASTGLMSSWALQGQEWMPTHSSPCRETGNFLRTARRPTLRGLQLCSQVPHKARQGRCNTPSPQQGPGRARAASAREAAPARYYLNSSKHFSFPPHLAPAPEPVNHAQTRPPRSATVQWPTRNGLPSSHRLTE